MQDIRTRIVVDWIGRVVWFFCVIMVLALSIRATAQDFGNVTGAKPVDPFPTVAAQSVDYLCAWVQVLSNARSDPKSNVYVTGQKRMKCVENTDGAPAPNPGADLTTIGSYLFRNPGGLEWPNLLGTGNFVRPLTVSVDSKVVATVTSDAAGNWKWVIPTTFHTATSHTIAVKTADGRQVPGPLTFIIR